MTPMDPPEHLQIGKGQGATKSKKASEHRPMKYEQTQVLLLSLLTHRRTLSYVLDVVKVATGAEIVHSIISVIFVG